LNHGTFDSYKNWNLVGEALKENGFTKKERNKILDGNFMIMFEKISA